MKLSKLVEHIEYELVQGSLDTEVADIAYDSRKIKEGMLFVAIAGTVVDGHKYIPDVVKKGASVLVVEKEIESIDESITVIRVANGRAALSLLSQAYFDYPLEEPAWNNSHFHSTLRQTAVPCPGRTLCA